MAPRDRYLKDEPGKVGAKGSDMTTIRKGRWRMAGIFAHCGRVLRRLRTAVIPSAQARGWTLTLIPNVDHHVSQGARGYLAARTFCAPKDARFRYSTGTPAVSAASIPRLIPGVIPRSW